MAHRKQHFEKYATSMGFNALMPENWYSVQLRDIMNVKGTRNVILYHNNSVSKALLDLFPSIGIERSKFSFCQKTWTNAASRKYFFEMYAAYKHFDPLIAKNWYSQSSSDIMAMKGAKNVIRHHGNSISQALISLFPNIGLAGNMFLFRQHAWDTAEKRKSFFEHYAHSAGFDPLLPTNWYFQSKCKILASKGARSVLSYHSYSIPQALIELFPKIGLVKSQFKFM
eukprot:Phypoly_transcript_04545.p2 GENE.Phypoly_transcript_04545~~Phypoly_transcript_04545.p2  ORF type:complete len:226 (+),score=15.15 Phypoly_transcript_04545:1408-2085(+)